MLSAALFSPFIDPWVLPHGFRRHANQPRYRRKLGTTTQRIEVSLQGRHRDHPGAVAVYPWLEVQFPELDAVMEAMLGEARRGSLRQPIDVTSNKLKLGWWLVHNEADIARAAADVGQFITDWTLPFLDQYLTLNDVRDAELRIDGRVMRDRHQMLHGVSAILLTTGPTAALARLNELFGSPGLRTQYAQAFEYLEQRRLN